MTHNDSPPGPGEYRDDNFDEPGGAGAPDFFGDSDPLAPDSDDDVDPVPDDLPEDAFGRRRPDIPPQPPHEQLPTRDNPLRSNFDGLGGAVAHVTDLILRDAIHQTVVDGYVIRGVELSVTDVAGPLGTPPERRTGIEPLARVAANSSFARVDEILGSRPDFIGLEPSARVPYRQLTMGMVRGVLQGYGVDPSEVTFVSEGERARFEYNGNAVEMTTTLPGVTDVTAWDSRMPPGERDRVWEENNLLTKRGAALMHINHYLQSGEPLPPSLRYLEDVLQTEYDDIQAAVAEHTHQVRQHAVANGFRHFQVHSQGCLRFGLPIALHLIEQSPADAYTIVGDYSATNGFIAVRRPGFFTPVRNPSVQWVVGRDGRIRRTK